MDDASTRLVALGEESLARAAAGEGDTLAPLLDETDALLAQTPAAQLDRNVLERASDINREVQRLLAAARDEVAAELGRLGRGRTGVGAYARSLNSTAARPTTGEA